MELTVADSFQDAGKVDGTFPEVLGLVLQVELADAIAAQPTDLPDDVEMVPAGVADIVIDLDRL